MRCPACENKMTQIQARGIPVDVCRGGCGGVWFDKFEFRKFDEPHEFAGETLLEVEKDDSAQVDHAASRLCPRCANITMVRHFFSARKLVQIDECYGCAGVWLDAGELKKIRGLFASDDERRDFNQQAFDAVLRFGLSSRVHERDQHLRKRRHLAAKAKLICPSYYLDGTRDWGAF